MFTFTTERYTVTGRNERRVNVDRTGAIRIAREATCPYIGPRTSSDEINFQIAAFLREGRSVRLGRHALEPTGGAGFRLWIVPLAHNEDGLRDVHNFAAGARCARTISCYQPDRSVRPDFDRIADAFRETWNADADDLPEEIVNPR